MTPEQILNIDSYLAEHCQKAKMTRILAEICETMDGTLWISSIMVSEALKSCRNIDRHSAIQHRFEVQS